MLNFKSASPQLAIIKDTKRYFSWEDHPTAKVHNTSFPYRSRDLCLISKDIQDHFKDYDENQRKVYQERSDKAKKNYKGSPEFLFTVGDLVTFSYAKHSLDHTSMFELSCNTNYFAKNTIFALCYGNSNSENGYSVVPLKPKEFEIIPNIKTFDDLVDKYYSLYSKSDYKNLSRNNLEEKFKFLFYYNSGLIEPFKIPIEGSQRKKPYTKIELKKRENQIQKENEEEFRAMQDAASLMHTIVGCE